MAYVIGVDLGTQSMKGLLVDPQGKIVAEASSSYDPIYPSAAWAEEVPADWIHALKKIVHELLETSGVAPQEIGTIGMDAINDSVVAIDRDGAPLMNSIIWPSSIRSISRAWASSLAMPSLSPERTTVPSRPAKRRSMPAARPGASRSR